MTAPSADEVRGLLERLRSTLPVCPFDRRSPDYHRTSPEKPCHVCGGTEEVDRCRGADTRCMSEAADLIEAQAAALAEAQRRNSDLADLAQTASDSLDAERQRNWTREGALEIALGQWKVRAEEAKADLAAERERCAKKAASIGDGLRNDPSPINRAYSHGCDDIAAAIRQGGEHG